MLVAFALSRLLIGWVTNSYYIVDVVRWIRTWYLDKQLNSLCSSDWIRRHIYGTETNYSKAI